MRRPITTRASREVAMEVMNQISGEKRDSPDGGSRDWQGLLTSPEAVFADPVEYLRRLGLEAELIEQGAVSLAPAA